MASRSDPRGGYVGLHGPRTGGWSRVIACLRLVYLWCPAIRSARRAEAVYRDAGGTLAQPEELLAQRMRGPAMSPLDAASGETPDLSDLAMRLLRPDPSTRPSDGSLISFACGNHRRRFCAKDLSAGTSQRRYPARIGHFHFLSEAPYSEPEESRHEVFLRTAG